MRVKYYASYRDITGCRDEVVSASGTVGNLLRTLAKRHGEKLRKKLLSPDCQELGPDAIVLVNGRNITFLGMLEAPLSDTDTIAIFPIVAGG